MKVSELYDRLCGLIPKDLSCDWDNDGIMVMPDGEKEVKRVLLTLDVTENAVIYAEENGFDLIVSHHPLIFKPINGVTDIRIIRAVRSGISVFSFHTRLDRVEGGVNTELGRLLGLHGTRRFGEDDLGVIGELDVPVSDYELAERIKDILGSPMLRCSLSGRSVKTVAVVGGDGDDYILSAYESGAEMYLSGTLGYNDMTDAAALDISLASAGHFYTEQPVLRPLSEMIKSISSDIYCEIFDCNVIEII